MKIKGPTYFRVTASILLQTWLLPFTNPVNIREQSENLKEHLKIQEDLPFSLAAFIPTAALSMDHSRLISQQCIEDSRMVVKAVLNRTEWALSSIYFLFTISSI